MEVSCGASLGLLAVLAFLLTPGERHWDKGAMISWRTLACPAVLCLALAGCGDDGEPGGFSAGSAGLNTEASSSGSSSSSDSSSGSPGSSSSTTNPTTGSDTSSTSIDPTSGSTTAPPLTTGDTTDTTGDTSDTSTGPNPTTMTQTTDPAGCGNGNIDPNEQCDGGNLNGFTCESLGNAGGSLGCDPVTCTFDTSLCMGNTDPSTSG